MTEEQAGTGNQQASGEPVPSAEPAKLEQEEAGGLNPEGAGAAMSEPNSFEPEEG